MRRPFEIDAPRIGDVVTRRYTDEEFRAILRTALAMHEERSGATVAESGEGLALAEIEAIAAEVGVDPELVRQAADKVDLSDPSALAGPFGTNRVIRMDGLVDVELDEQGLLRLVDAIRGAADAPGETQSVLGGFEWKRGGEMSQTHVSLSPRDGQTRVRVSVDRTAGMSASGAFAIVGGIFSVLATIVAATEDLGMLIPVFTTLPVAASVALVAAIWKRSGLVAAREAQRIVNAVVGEGRALASARGDSVLGGPRSEALPAPEAGTD